MASAYYQAFMRSKRLGVPFTPPAPTQPTNLKPIHQRAINVTYGTQPQPPKSPATQTADFTSAITPEPAFSPADTSRQFQQIMATGRRSAASAGHGLALPGISVASPALQSRSVAGAAQAMGNAMGQASQSRLADAIANAKQILAGQSARAGDFANMIGSSQLYNQADQQYQQQMMDSLLGALLWA